MTLRELGEFGFIERLAAMGTCALPGLEVGIGDDCAIVNFHGGRLAIKADMMVEGRHFRLDWMTPEEAGARAMTAVLSDLAAMGARPLYALTSLALPPEWPAEQALALGEGLLRQAESHGACLAGGDTVAAHEHAVVDVMAIGECGEHIWLRSGAQAGDGVYVTGRLGGPAAAVAAKLRGLAGIPSWERYSRPVPRVAQAGRLNRLEAIHAAMDISDGLVQDARHVATRSGVGIVIEAARLPVYPGVEEIAARLGLDPLQWALGGGEEFELLITAPVKAAQELQAAAGDLPVTLIGAVTAGEGVVVVDEAGRAMPVPSAGWDQFRS